MNEYIVSGMVFWPLGMLDLSTVKDELDHSSAFAKYSEDNQLKSWHVTRGFVPLLL